MTDYTDTVLCLLTGPRLTFKILPAPSVDTKYQLRKWRLTVSQEVTLGGGELLRDKAEKFGLEIIPGRREM